ncbi:type IV pilus twitching motility protein PilT [Proteiniclasticum sp. SCR006]|uniref:Type IV pilus twitching motility protein PilT n=1 Tax=Proteiniclasticum aestuarii TaxID=2817862 RepID=A0A939HDL1_9CLOT|nr:type IV pilus twitching motility protein PilT [Proteiniclasticum aestuarii]MBO1266032.1 type IV pilus twitching motility protein PilT [Proteiniclasticum aestuarii]
MNLQEILGKATEKAASDVHLAVGSSPLMRVNGKLIPITETVLQVADMDKIVQEHVSNKERALLLSDGETDFSYEDESGRYRVNLFRERMGYAAAFRVIGARIPSFRELGLPSVMESFTRLRKGLVLITGPTGSGKTTTLASMIDRINEEQEGHIITLEDPVEYLHHHKKSLISQREIHRDSKGFAEALRASLRQDPDVILVGEMRDLDTIGTAITAAETGHLVLSTLHTSSAAQTVDRIIDVFPPHQQAQIRLQLSMVLEGVVSQKLIPKADGSGRVAAFEIMTGTTGVRNLIREGKVHMLQTLIQTGASSGMISMDSSILALYREKVITKESAVAFALDQETMKKQIFGLF